MSGSAIDVVPLSDGDLLFDEIETRQILIFFWPQFSGRIQDLTVTNGVRRFAQQCLIAAIDASYAMGYIDALGRAVASRGSLDIRSLGRKLAGRFLKQWWRHATEKDLQDAKVYETVRRTVARSYRTSLDDLLAGLQSMRQPSPLLVVGIDSMQCWV
ncbi:hypothetical protein C1704_00605 [Caldimonas caldifontis]|uniref:Uncharacterized protein n=2 Tax=Caldimonas caldifontis TaxID=1452508 RepID=A0A2S5SZ27_9BURK|nr:hypothetical protein C1704_00605 [Caldimonas caldifontis]